MSDQAQQGPAKPAPSLYDIGAFFSGGLNTTVEEWRERLELLRSIDVEYDQGQAIDGVPADLLLDLIEAGLRLAAMWEDDTHILVVVKPLAHWTMEHSLRCRATGNMAGCRYHRAMEIHTEADGHLPPTGRHRLRFEGTVPDDPDDLFEADGWTINWDPVS